MQLSGAPPKIVEAFAVNAAPSGGYGGKRTVPVPSQTGITPGAASYNDGFPPLTMTPLTGGGVVMSGLDMNGILNEATAVDWWMSAGAGFPFDGTFATAVGGYPKGSRLLMASGNGYWLSIIDNNSNNPDTGGAGWIPDRAVASVYASGTQVLASGNSKVLWNSVEFDAFGLWDSGNDRFKALWAGKYCISGSIYIPAGAAPANIGAMVYQNGTLAKFCNQFPAISDQPLSYSFDAIIQCAVNDHLEAFVNNGNAASINAGPLIGSSQAFVYGQLQYLGAN
jgi:hypothetical protein